MSKTKRALPEDIDITTDAPDVPPEQEQAEAMAEMQLWDAAKNLKDKLWIGTVVMDFDSGATKYSIAIASDSKPTAKQVMLAIAETTDHDYENMEFLQKQGRTVHAWSERLDIVHAADEPLTEVPF